jgi:hypothetical protein
MNIEKSRKKLFCYCLLIAFIFSSCGNNSTTYEARINDRSIKVRLEQKTDSSSVLTLTVDNQIKSSWALEYPVYRFDFGDVTGDGVPEIAVGVIKPTRFDPRPAKRLFLFKITENYYIRPLWLGSRTGQPLVDFRIIQKENENLIRTIERERNGNYLLAEYRWRGFGPEFIQYIEREISPDTSQKILIKTITR